MDATTKLQELLLETLVGLLEKGQEGSPRQPIEA